MPRNIIDLGYDVPAVQKQTDAVVAQMERVLETAEKLGKLKMGFADGFSGLGAFKKETDQLLKTQGELLKQSQQYTKVLAEQTKQQNLAKKASQESEKAKQQELKTEQEVIKTILAEEKAEQEALKTKKAKQQESEKVAKQALQEKKIIDDIANDYLQLSKAYNDAALKAKNYALRLGENHPVTIQAIKDAKEMHDILLRVDQSVGQSQRNVGNYKSAFDGLGMSFTQVARELPSLAINTQTFLLAISNNLPLVVDEISRAKKEIAELKAQGKDTPSLFERITTSLISWQVALSIGITLLTLYGKQIIDWVGRLITGKKALEEITQSQIDLSQALLDGRDRWESFSKIIQESVLNELSLLKQRIEILKATGSTAEEIFNAEEKYNTARKQFAIQQLTGQKESQKLSEQQLRTFQALQAGRLFEIGTITKKINDTDLAIASTSDEDDKKIYENKKKYLALQLTARKQDYEKTNTLLEQYYQSEQDIAATQRELYDKQRTAVFEKNKLILEDEIATNQRIADNDSMLYKFRSEAAQKVFELTNKLIVLENEYQNSQNNISGAEIEKNNTEAAIKRKETLVKLNEDVFNILVDRVNFEREINEEEKKIIEDWTKENEDAAALFAKIQKDIENAATGLVKEEIGIIKNGADAMARVYETAYVNHQRQLLEQFNKGIISRKEYEEKLVELQTTYAKRSLIIEIEAAKARLALLKPGTKEYDELANAIAKAELALVKLGKSEASSLDKLKKNLSDVAQISSLLTQAITNINDIAYENKKAQLEELNAQQEKNYEAEIARITDSTLAEEDKANKLKILEAERAAQKEQNDRRQRSEDNKKARFDRDLSILNIITGTAAAVVKALPNLPLAIAVGVLGAAQLAKALFVKIPQYAGGLENNPKPHFGIYGEAGAELVDIPGQSPFIADQPTLGFLPRGTNITPIKTDELNEAANRAMMRKTAETIKLGEAIRRMEKQNQMEGFLMLAHNLNKNFAKYGKNNVRINITDNADFKIWKDKKIYGKG